MFKVNSKVSFLKKKFVKRVGNKYKSVVRWWGVSIGRYSIAILVRKRVDL